MSSEKWLVIGTDARLRMLAKHLTSPNRTVYYKSTTVWDDELNTVSLEVSTGFRRVTDSTT